MVGASKRDMSDFYDDIVPQIRKQGRLRFDFLGGIFPDKKIAPTDIDNMFEHYGHFLVFEFKQPGEEMPRGQELALQRFQQLNPGKVSILQTEGIPPAEIHRHRWLGISGTWNPWDWTESDALVVRDIARHWWKWVEEKHAQ